MSFYVPSTPSRHRSRAYSLAQPAQLPPSAYPYPTTPYSGYNNTLGSTYYDTPGREEVVVTVVPVTETVIPTILTTILTTVITADPTVPLPIGTIVPVVIIALIAIMQARLTRNILTITIPQQLASAYFTSSVWGTVTATLTSMVVLWTIAADLCTSIKICLDI
ncbi:hypothetical protein B0F90DRAFT_1667687 [Multifurca ochricompacta]|uniref:Uncharacterized protein n=1 Tax=Multifurca ochricompacta TaxID=376703 RepID=A0AAD4QP46_9AGAM|nr:hypothetical protein B0F90DRAFT_1667687 [Multifurca ochricompacta]